MPEELEWGRVLAATAVVLGALLAGIVLGMVLRRLTRRAEGTRWAWDDLVARLVRDLAPVLATAAGAWAAVPVVGLDRAARDVTGRILLAIVIFAVTLASARLLAGVVTSVALGRSGVAQSVSLFANITRAVVLVLGFLVLLQSLGVSITPLLAGLGVGGLAVALALQDTLANLFAGVHVLASKTVQPGDFIRLSSGEEGHVVDINWRKTTVRTLADNLIIVPNARFADAILTNFSQPAQDMSVLIQASVGYDSDLEHVEKVTVEVGREVMAEVDGGITDFDPLVRFHTFGDSALGFTVILRTRQFGDQFLIKHEFVKRLHQRYRTEGIQIPYPTRSIVFAGGPPGSHTAP